MNEKEATELFYEYINKQKHYKKVEILSVEEKELRFLFEFSEKDDEQPIDYPIISIHKKNKQIEELLFVNQKDREIIYGN